LKITYLEKKSPSEWLFFCLKKLLTSLNDIFTAVFIVCTIASLGGPTVNKIAPVQSMKITLLYTAPNQIGLQFTPSGTVAFDGIDASNATAGVVIRVK
jgi:hypothetical protein